jgi:hypothetical protein
MSNYTPGCLTLNNATNGRKTDFEITPAGLYAFEIPIEGSTSVQTIEENQLLFIPR